MRTRRPWTRGSSRRLTALFLVVLVPPAVTLVWLGLRLLEQDRSLWAQRDLERRQATAETIVRSLEQSLGEAERWLAGGAIPDGALRLQVSSAGVQADPAGRVLWLPLPPATQEGHDRRFAEAERFEFQGAAPRALAAYEEQSHAQEPGVRAGALLRAARVHRREGRVDDALRAYRNLAGMHRVAIYGMPADLLARRAVCDLLGQSGRSQELKREAAGLEADFLAGRWTLDHATWELSAGQIAQWTGRPVPASVERKALSAAVDWLWGEWQHLRTEQPSGRRLILAEVTPVTLLWRTAGSSMAAVAVLPSVLQVWQQRPMESARNSRDRLSLLTESGRIVTGSETAPGPQVVKRPATETRLPWTLVVSPGDMPVPAQEFAARRRILSLGLAAIVLLLAGSSYLLWRVVQRELAVARLQTDFVSAVSHEFRTPLTSLRHFTELLEEDDNVPLDRRKTFYAALGRNTERLHRLVESLLDFARMEGGRKPYDFQAVDAGKLAAQVVADFQKEVGPHGFTVDLEVEAPGVLLLRADAAALTHALWNLLDNAVKYSTDRHSVRVSVGHHVGGVAISVQDHGVGIPRSERKEIFRKFVRGEKAQQLKIKGTGLGLAMVSHIVDAHGGAIEIESEEGKGSTFRLVLPSQV